VVERTRSVRQPRLSGEADGALNADGFQTSGDTVSGLGWKPSGASASAARPEGLEPPTFWSVDLRAASTGVQGCPHCPVLSGFHSSSVDDHPHKSAADGSLLGSHGRRWAHSRLCSGMSRRTAGTDVDAAPQILQRDLARRLRRTTSKRTAPNRQPRKHERCSGNRSRVADVGCLHGVLDLLEFGVDDWSE